VTSASRKTANAKPFTYANLMKFTLLRRKVNAMMRVFTTVDRQSKYFKAQQEAIRHLLQDEGFTRVIEYREREADATMDRLSDSKLSMEELRYLQGRHSVSKEFLDWVDNMGK
jgi:hypothetical protein